MIASDRFLRDRCALDLPWKHWDIALRTWWTGPASFLQRRIWEPALLSSIECIEIWFFFFFWRIRLVIIMQKVYRAHEWQNASIVSHWFWQLTDNSHVSDISFAREWTSQDGNDIRKSSNISTMTLYPIHHMPNISIPVPHIHNHMVYTYNDIPLAATIRSTECL